MDNVELKKIKEEIKKIEWDKISDDWMVNYCPKFTDNRIIFINPSRDCTKTNPLYLHKGWFEYMYKEENLNLSNRIISKICGVDPTTINRWRKKHQIPLKKGSGQWIDSQGYLRRYMPDNYQHPELLPQKGRRRYIRFEHDIVMEQYLSKHPDAEWSKKYLINGKYLKKGTIIHHINYIHHDNRLKNLYIFDNDTFHKNAEKSLYKCFENLIKLNQIGFKNGNYYLNKQFDYRSLSSFKIKERLSPITINPYKDITLIKETIKKINWDKISDNWKVKYHINKYTPYKTISLDPYSDCSEENPLYRHKAWIEHLVNQKKFNLTDSRLGKVCGVSRAKIVYWREKVHKIYTRDKGWGYKRFYQKDGRIWIKIPNDYNNPFAEKHNKYMVEHRYIIERYLVEHPESEISQKYLIDGKYLKSECEIHHINFDPLDNRLENLWICENGSEHKLIEGSILSLVDELIKLNFIVFTYGEYNLPYET